MKTCAIHLLYMNNMMTASNFNLLPFFFALLCCIMDEEGATSPLLPATHYPSSIFIGISVLFEQHTPDSYTQEWHGWLCLHPSSSCEHEMIQENHEVTPPFRVFPRVCRDCILPKICVCFCVEMFGMHLVSVLSRNILARESGSTR